MKSLDRYITSAPSAQTALDIFAGSWVSQLPAPLAELQAGPVPLFEDARIGWAAEQLGDFKDRTVLEAEIQRKNQHIAELELLIKRIESGRVMRLLRRLKQ